MMRLSVLIVKWLACCLRPKDQREFAMQMKIGVVGLGIGIPRTNLQVSAMNIVKLYLRHSQHDKNIAKLDVHDLISVGGKSGAFIFSGFETKWFELDPKRDDWAHNPILLIGRKVQIDVSGVVAKWGQVDISLKIYDKYNQGEELLNQCCVEVVGGLQFSDAKVMGTIGKSEI
jgi:hypothetical protein